MIHIHHPQHQKQRRLSAEHLSQRVFYLVLALCVVVFGLFYLWGYDRPYEGDYSMNAPLFTNLLLVLMYVLTIAAVGVAIYAGYTVWKKQSRESAEDNNVPVRKIRMWVWIGTAVCLLLTVLFGSSAPMRINGAWFTDVLWLKVSDMFILTSIILLLAAAGAAVFGATRYYRRKEHRL